MKKTRDLNRQTAHFHRLYCNHCDELLTYASEVWADFRPVFKAAGWTCVYDRTRAYITKTYESDPPKDFLCPNRHRATCESYALNTWPAKVKVKRRALLEA